MNNKEKIIQLLTNKVAGSDVMSNKSIKSNRQSRVLIISERIEFINELLDIKLTPLNFDKIKHHNFAYNNKIYRLVKQLNRSHKGEKFNHIIIDSEYDISNLDNEESYNALQGFITGFLDEELLIEVK